MMINHTTVGQWKRKNSFVFRCNNGAQPEPDNVFKPFSKSSNKPNYIVRLVRATFTS